MATTPDSRSIATLLAAGRLVIGVGASLFPEVGARSWIGEHGRGPAGKVLGRALGARDLALAVGALSSLEQDEQFWRWIRLGALADTADALATVLNWRSLPKMSRIGVFGIAASAAALGAVLGRAERLDQTAR
ncbi:MAG TPA: hypothetical protein VHZ97_27785 [Pseudonocardiaceae bacterium]|jgi:hypothetical protein|nr:hypothetical protein [Pseudonocardiaceae bacterium]